MTTPLRLSTGGRIDRGRKLKFRFDGRAYEGLAGDTLASALLANGVHLVGRSFKYHRPRGIVALGVEEPNALVGVTRGDGRYDPNTRATTLELFDGLEAESQNRWPSLDWDVGAINGLISPVTTAGFYYKTFMWPRSAWSALYEPAIRRLAGLGRAPRSPDPDRYAFLHEHCDVLVVGGGAAGLSAALAAADDGLSVVLCDDGSEIGGALLTAPDALIGTTAAWPWLAKIEQDLARRGVRVLPRATVFAAYADNMFGVCERLQDHVAEPRGPRERLSFVRARRVIFAAGAMERPLVFRNNDRPGIMLASAAAGYVTRYAALPGRRAVICANDDSAYAAALTLGRAGAQVTLADARSDVDGEHVEAAGAAGVHVRRGMVPVDARGTRRVRALALARVGDRGAVEWLDCDVVGMAGGWTPTVHLHSQARGTLAWCDALGAFKPAFAPAHARSAGGCDGVLDLDAAAAHGAAVGEAVRRDLLGRRGKAHLPSAVDARPHAPIAAPRGAMAFVDFQNDVTAKDIALADREGFRSIEHIKRYTTAGMATDQGRTSNINTLQIAAQIQRRPAAAIGHTTFRQPYTPVTFGAIAGRNRGRLFDPTRTTPIDSWAMEQGAVFENVGLWRRARYFPRAGEDMRAAVDRECRATRAAAGLFDASTLGKIEVVGPDAAEFMNRLYVNAWTKLEPGRCRYGVMLREDGFVFDDGVVGRLSHDRFHVTTTTTGAPAVLHHMEDYLQTEFPDLRVWLTSTTDQWAVIALNGPAARDILSPLVEGIDLSREAFPHMSVRTGVICGAPCRLFRVSFTGELGFEINVPARFARSTWEAVHRAGQAHGLTAYGTETMHVLRAEKGYVIIGQETDGTVTPGDLGLGWAIGKTKADFVGQRSLLREDLARSGRPQLVGLKSLDRASILEEGAQVVAGPGAREPLGHVTSAYWSATLGEPIALALVADGRARVGETLAATSLEGPARSVQVVEPVFYDPKGERLDA